MSLSFNVVKTKLCRCVFRAFSTTLTADSADYLANFVKESKDATLWHRKIWLLNLSDHKKLHYGINGDRCEVCEVCSMFMLHELLIPKCKPRRTDGRAGLKSHSRIICDAQFAWGMVCTHVH